MIERKAKGKGKFISVYGSTVPLCTDISGLEIVTFCIFSSFQDSRRSLSYIYEVVIKREIGVNNSHCNSHVEYCCSLQPSAGVLFRAGPTNTARCRTL